ncbi:MAG TPA: flagellin [Nitrosopumilaceae archaeon]|nr:flagellin [Nitrosopumilaceae archaeon]
MASGIMSEAILIIASVVIATSVAGVVMSQVGVFESTFTATTEGQKDTLLTNFKIVMATNTTDDTVSIWLKNVGQNPISSLDKIDVYFGEIGQIQNIPYDPSCVPPAACTDDTWRYDSVSTLWQIMDTLSINITDNDIIRDVTYQVTIISPNGVTAENIFSLPG